MMVPGHSIQLLYGAGSQLLRPVFNFLLAFVLSVIIVGCIGYDPATVLEVTEGSSAEKTGLEVGDVITEYQGYHIDLGKDLYVYSYLNQLEEDDTIHLKVKRDGEIKEFSYKPDVNVDIFWALTVLM